MILDLSNHFKHWINPKHFFKKLFRTKMEVNLGKHSWKEPVNGKNGKVLLFL
jgi:hypothetical protein